MSERKPARLIVLPPSHYCERARWALDRAMVRYREERWAVGVHLPLARRIAPKSTLPILDTGDQVIQGSDRILDWIGLPGADPELEGRLSERIGPLIRRYLYAGALNEPGSPVRNVVLDGVPAWQAAIGRVAWPAIRRRMIQQLDARPELLQAMEGELNGELTWLDDRMRERRFLVGDAFGRADITAASLLSPLARPEALPIYRKGKLPDAIEATLARWAARPSLRWVSETYAAERHA